MSEAKLQLKRWFHEKTAPHGVKTKLAEASGFSTTQISRMRNLDTDDPKNRQEIPIEMIEKAARFFNDLPPGFEGMTEWLDESQSHRNRVKIVGLLGAGAEVEPDFEQVPEGGLDEIAVPFPLPAEMVAFEVKGPSMQPAYHEGSIIITYREQRKPLEQFYGREAAVRTDDGRRYIKTIMSGSKKGTVTLSSFNASPLENQKLVWIGEIFAVLPAASIRHIERIDGWKEGN